MHRYKQRGFTIVELMIVLAIAGLILLIFLLAVPALQRNSRNNQRSQDVAALLGAVSQYQLNNSGMFPDDKVDVLLKNAKISYYEGGNIAVTALPSRDSSPNNTGVENLVIYNRSKCKTDDGGERTYTGAGYSDIVALYSIETGSGAAHKCQEL